MSKNKKTIACGGLAFSEEKDMQKLSDLAKEGWILDSFKYLSYQLKKSEPEDVIYCVDYNNDKNDLESYFEIFKECNWEHVCSYEVYHFFKAKPGTVPIYSDVDTLNLKYKGMHDVIKKAIKYFIVMAFASGLIANRMEHITSTANIYEGIKLLSYIVCGTTGAMIIPFLVCSAFVKRKINPKH